MHWICWISWILWVDVGLGGWGGWWVTVMTQQITLMIHPPLIVLKPPLFHMFFFHFFFILTLWIFCTNLFTYMTWWPFQLDGGKNSFSSAILFDLKTYMCLYFTTVSSLDSRVRIFEMWISLESGPQIYWTITKDAAKAEVKAITNPKVFSFTK